MRRSLAVLCRWLADVLERVPSDATIVFTSRLHVDGYRDVDSAVWADTMVPKPPDLWADPFVWFREVAPEPGIAKIEYVGSAAQEVEWKPTANDASGDESNCFCGDGEGI